MAAFLCITPLLAALSIAEEVALRATAAAAGSCAAADSNFLIEVRTPLFTIRLRRFFFSLTLTRYLADLIFGNWIHLLQRIDVHTSLFIITRTAEKCKGKIR